MSLPPLGGLRLAVALDAPALAGAQRQLGAFLSAGGCTADIQFRVELVVEEVVMNVIRHARPRGATQVTVDAQCAGGLATIAIEDDGPAFDPLMAPVRSLAGAQVGSHEGGFGLHLIRRHSDAAEYARSGARNRLELAFGPRAV